MISPSHVLTAAHCVEDKDCSHYSVGVGMHTNDVRNGTRVEVSQISVHPNYTFNCGISSLDGMPDFDFSIIHLASPVDLNDKVIPACLPDEELGGEKLAGKILTVSGWGFPFPGVLHKAQYPGQTNENCKYYNYYTEKECDGVTENMLCAGDPYKLDGASSRGDSGGKVSRLFHLKTYRRDNHFCTFFAF